MTARHILEVFGVVVIVYFATLNALYIGFTALAWRSITRYLSSREYAAVDEAFASPMTPPISILLPAYNEQAGVVQSVTSLLQLRYPELEVIVVNDGSTDDTLGELSRGFDLAPAPRALRGTIPHAPIRATYRSRRHHELVVVDKDNGGKADALNAGVDAARYPYVCAVDADALIEPEALLRVAKPLLDDPDIVVATGGIVRIVNGCTVRGGRVVDIRLPASRLATLQVVEYFRAFLVGRVGWSQLRALLIISGAFGVFRRATVEEVGGWWPATVGEDMELVVRMHRELRRRGRPYSVQFVPDPVCWTEAPETLRVLSRQRRRWQRGLAEALWRHRALMLNPRYGALGLVAMPYFVVFELLGPPLSLLGYLVLPLAWALGALSVGYLLSFFLVAVLLGQLLSISALALEEFSFRRHPESREVLRMLRYAALENFGYRQLSDVWRGMAFWDLARRRRGWGEMTRRGFQTAPTEQATAGEPAGTVSRRGELS
jgi:cellulose synthase/poly-beta-1,6-N-acetylglucosamine synthase-like glycosyltransferase